MKGPKAILAALVAAGLLAGATPASAGAAAYTHYVACGVIKKDLTEKDPPSHSCPMKSKKGAFFRSNKESVFYMVCVHFPTKKTICAEEPQEAKKGVLYINEITSTIPGKHKVIWFVKGKRIGTFTFNVSK
jgi:ssDNA-binding Zn-finger/Zn-ribbon topoisomerase 1